jgi:DNA-binding NarL/FixJ family response regulator
MLAAMLQPAQRSLLPGVAVVAADRRVRDSLASVLTATGRVEVVGLAADSAAAIRLAGNRRPEVILVDPVLLAGGGNLIADLRRQVPRATILLVDWDDRSDPVLPIDADGILDVGRLPGALLAVLPAGTWGTD